MISWRCMAALSLLATFCAMARAQDAPLPVDPNSLQVRQAQKECVEKMKPELLKQGVRPTSWGAEEEAFQRCKAITGWQSPQ
jgi:hypothetical protein